MKTEKRDVCSQEEGVFGAIKRTLKEKTQIVNSNRETDAVGKGEFGERSATGRQFIGLEGSCE